MTADQVNAAKTLILVYFLFTWGGSLLAYRRNRLLPEDDPRKQKYTPLDVLIAPASIPILVLVLICLLTIFSILFGVFLVLFTLAMLIFRQVTLLKKLIEIWVKIGGALLRIAHLILWPFYSILKAVFAPEEAS